MKSENYDQTLRLLDEFRDETGSDDRELMYCEALALEGLRRWSAALDLFRELGAETAPDRVRLVAGFGIVRCLLAQGHEADAVRALDSCERECRGWHHGHAEVAFLRAVIALKHVSKPEPGPFAPDAVAWTPLEPAAGRYLEWLPVSNATAAEDEIGSTPLDHSRHEPATPVTPQEHAEAAVRDALALAVEHPSHDHLRLSAANLAFAAGRTTEAMRGYQRLRDDAPHSPAVIQANYNLGLAHFKVWALASARAAFTDAGDLDPRGRFSRLGWWWIGRIELDRGDTAAARTAWDKTADRFDREIESAVGLGEILTRLLDVQSDAASKQIRQHKTVSAFPHPELAEAFAARLRYTNAESSGRGDALAVAVKTAEYGRAFGPAGEYLLGRWLSETGRPEEAAAVYETATETARGMWALRMTFGIGEHLLRTKHSTRAKPRFAVVAAADPGELGDRARLHLAELALADADGATCVAHCRTLLDHGTVGRDVILRLMGRGFELMGRRSSAADCFAGRVPDGGPRNLIPESRP